VGSRSNDHPRNAFHRWGDDPSAPSWVDRRLRCVARYQATACSRQLSPHLVLDLCENASGVRLRDPVRKAPSPLGMRWWRVGLLGFKLASSFRLMRHARKSDWFQLMKSNLCASLHRLAFTMSADRSGCWVGILDSSSRSLSNKSAGRAEYPTHHRGCSPLTRSVERPCLSCGQTNRVVE
jgi:hypothetical protein